ncbi:gamma-glutamyltransferase [Oxynema sp. CENA135]|uniref:gamma-glutamyltransferase n=1 Tax=Oxynema sp. CENA135 TaxID=984206 RepID=UPI001909EB20|nr:gamma-glutamyltransferase [Oxynema sp. CENA135]MBK4728954.1 gamma-glutamyltransferase [Oxynema sp. CENA135]
MTCQTLRRFSVTLISISLCVVGGASTPTGARAIQGDRAERGMVVSAHPLASEAGVEILSQGGNAIDAAVATALAISVVEPFSAGIGGGGFLLLREGDTGEIRALDFRERAPLAATSDMYVDENGDPIERASLDGHRAVAVPGTIAGLARVQETYGELPWSTVVAPAIRLARDGFTVGDRLVSRVRSREEVLLSNPAGRAIFSRDGAPYREGDRLVQADLGRTLRSIARDPQNFYTGDIARAIASDMAANGGLISLEDLQAYEPIWRSPVCGDWRSVRICSMPPPSSGGVHLLQILHIIGDLEARSLGWHHPDVLHLLVEAMRVAYADRAEYLGDPDFVEVPVARLIDPRYASWRRSQIEGDRVRRSDRVEAVDPQTLRRLTSESTDTTHLTVVDDRRTVVSMTFTINGNFGAGVVAAGTGIVLNNEMDDFAIAPGVPNLYGLVGDEANAIAPRKTPLSSMTPAIVTENGQFRMAAGSPGGSTIITTVLQILFNVLVYDMDAESAVAAPRLHHQWLPDRLWVEQWGFDAMTLQELERRGHQIQELPGWGNANAIVLTEEGMLEGAADPRGEGAARGFSGLY